MRKTSAYARKRRYVDPLAGMRAISGMIPFNEEEQAKLSWPVRLSWQKFMEGMATDHDFDVLACIVNVATMRAASIGSKEVWEACRAGQESLMRIKARQDRTGKLGLDYQDREDLPTVIDIHEQLIELSTPKQMMEAMKEVLRRMSAGKVMEPNK